MIKRISIGVVIAGLVILVAGVILGWVIVPNIIEKMVKDQTQIKNGSQIYEKWQKIPIPIMMKFYFFNVTNSEDYLGMDDWSATPVLNEIGPYVYKETRVKYDIRSNTTADTVTFRSNTTYEFVRELSVGDDTDLVNVLNVPLVAVASVLSTFPALPVKVHDVIFGYRTNTIYDAIELLAPPLLNLTLPPEIHNGYFGIFLDRNATNANGLWEVYSGIKDSSKFNLIKSIDGRTRNSQWWSEECGMFNGSDGTMHPPFIKKDTIIYAYAPEICRSIWLRYRENIEYEGIPGYRFELPNEIFQSPKIHPSNQCFCMPARNPLNASCDFNGGVRLSSCKSGVPIALSKPHFLGAEESISNKVIGLKPDALLHEFLYDLEPTTGFPLSGNIRIQLSVETQPLAILGAPYNTLQHLFFPIIWVDENAALDEALVDEIKSKLINPLKLVKIGKWTVVGIGSFLTITGSAYFIYLTWIKK